MDRMDFNVLQVKQVLQRQCDKTWRFNNLLHNEYMAVIALNGKASYSIGCDIINVEKNDVIIFSPGVTRSGEAESQDPWGFIAIKFSVEYNDYSRDFFCKPYLHFHNIGTDIQNKFVDTAYIWEGKMPLYHIKCKVLILSILCDLICGIPLRNNISHMRKLEDARTFIQANYKNKIDIKSLSARLGLSPAYFRKLFNDAYGISPMQYIIKLRINTARDLLVSGELNVTEVAQMSGFNDVYYFSKLFKKETGISPSSLRHS